MLVGDPAVRETSMRLTRLAAALAASALVALALPASAHVRVSSPGAVPGGYAVLTFRVPTEGTSPTTQLEVLFPTGTPIAAVEVEPKLGWTYRVATSRAPLGLRDEHGPVQTFVSRITWTSTRLEMMKTPVSRSACGILP